MPLIYLLSALLSIPSANAYPGSTRFNAFASLAKRVGLDVEPLKTREAPYLVFKLKDSCQSTFYLLDRHDNVLSGNPAVSGDVDFGRIWGELVRPIQNFEDVLEAQNRLLVVPVSHLGGALDAMIAHMIRAVLFDENLEWHIALLLWQQDFTADIM